MDLLSALRSLPVPRLVGSALGLWVAYHLLYQAYRVFVYPYYVSPLRHLPGPTDHHFFIGQTLNQFRSGSPNEPFVSWVHKWPSAPFVRFFTFGNAEALLVTSLGAYRELSQSQCYSFEKPGFLVRLLDDIIGKGLFFAQAEDHKKQRKFLNDLFSMSNLKTFLPMFRCRAHDIAGIFDRAIETDGGVAEVVSIFSGAMLDAMGVFALGLELDTLKSSSDFSFDDCYHELFEPDTVGEALLAINAIIPIRWLPLDSNRRFTRAKTALRAQLRDIIRQRVAEFGGDRSSIKKPVVDGHEVKDLLSYMVENKYFATDGSRWTEDDILNQILTFMAAGHETTASSLTWAVHVLAQHPDVQARLRAEAMALFARSPKPDYTELERLPYLKNFTRELLRVYTPPVSVTREAIEDVVIQGVRIPKGTTVLMYPAVMHRNPEIWGENSDGFDPDRWDRLEGQAADAQAFAAFLHGPRMCIGRVMALMEFKTILVELLGRYEFQPAEGYSTVELVNPSPTLRPKRGLKVRVTRLSGE